MKQFQFSFNYI